MKRRNKIYIAGPISNNPGSFKRQFKEAETVLRYKGYRPVNPVRFTLFGKSLNGRSWHICMIVCLWHLLWCSHVFMLFGWGYSRGARLEHRFARFFHKHIIYQSKRKVAY